MICPKCKRSFASTQQVCPEDGERLVASVKATQVWAGATTPYVQGAAAQSPAQPMAQPVAQPAVQGSAEPASVPGLPAGDLPLEPGTMVGEYQITGLLGTGGMGAVYSGIQPTIGKRVAIKVLLRAFAAQAEVVARFIQEARAVNQVRSRYIVDIFSFGMLPDGRQYFVMEQLEGSSLRSYLKERRTLAFEEAHAILGAVAKGLAAAHAKGIVHRDIKPENIIVLHEEDGALTAKLLDFGIAKLQSNEGGAASFATRTGAAMGTPFYMSPEQCRGLHVDHRTDIYAFGIIMFEMFTGAVPFSSESYIELINKHLSMPPPLPRTLAPEISSALEALILRCIAKEPAERPQSMEELLAALAQLAPTLQGTCYPLGRAPVPIAGTQLATPARASRARPLFVAAAVLLIGAGAATFYWTARPPANLAKPLVASKELPPAPRPATLLLSTTPAGAQVWLDEQPQAQRTPLRLGMAAGRHRLRLVLAGHEERRAELELRAGQARELSYELVALAPPSAPLVVVTGQPRATYFLDGKLVGHGGTLTLAAVAPGAHQLRVVLPGRAALVDSIELRAGEPLRLDWQQRLRPSALRPARHAPTTKTKTTTKTEEDSDAPLDPFAKKPRKR